MRKRTQGYYCQPDGGQWNVPVYVHSTLKIDDEEYVVIGGTQLTSAVRTAGWGVLVCKGKDVHPTAQG